MIRRFGEFLLAKDSNAIVVAFLAALLPLFYLPTGFLAVVIVGLITLQKGAKSGLWVLAWIALPSLALLILRQVSIIDLLFLRCMAVWLLAVLLRRYHTWNLLLEVVSIVGVVAILALHLVKPNITQWWTVHLTNYLEQMASSTHWKMKMSPGEFAKYIALIASGLGAFFFALTVSFELAIARFWQSILVSPGAFGKEFTRIRLGYFCVAMLIVLLLMSAFKLQFAWDALPMAVFPFFIAGLSLLHFFAREKKEVMYILFFMYAGFFFLPVVVISMLVILALLDTWKNFRSKMI